MKKSERVCLGVVCVEYTFSLARNPGWASIHPCFFTMKLVGVLCCKRLEKRLLRKARFASLRCVRVHGWSPNGAVMRSPLLLLRLLRLLGTKADYFKLHERLPPPCFALVCSTPTLPRSLAFLRSPLPGAGGRPRKRHVPALSQQHPAGRGQQWLP